MCACGGVLETAAIIVVAGKVYTMMKNVHKGPCRYCGAVPCPETDTCPDCLIKHTKDLDTLDPFIDDSVTTTDLYPVVERTDDLPEEDTEDIPHDYLRMLSVIDATIK